MDAINREQFVAYLRARADKMNNRAKVATGEYVVGHEMGHCHAMRDIAKDIEFGRITLAFALSGDAPPLRTACEAMLNVLVDALWQVDCDRVVCGKPNRCDHCDFKEAASTAIKQAEHALASAAVTTQSRDRYLRTRAASAATPEGCTAAERKLLDDVFSRDFFFHMSSARGMKEFREKVERTAASARRGEWEERTNSD